MIENTYRCWEIFLLVVQCILLAINAILLWRYVISTRGIEEASTQQAKISADQLESSSRPVLALSGDALKLALENIGNGPALNIEWWVWPQGQDWPGSLEAPSGRMGFIDVDKSGELPHAPAFLTNPPRKVICRYESVGGIVYRSEGSIKRDSMVGVWYDQKFYRE
jgi:hypothetical protein